MINNQVPHSKTEHDETPGAEYPYENNSKDTETDKTVPTFMCKIPVNEIAESINYSNSKQREVLMRSRRGLKIM